MLRRLLIVIDRFDPVNKYKFALIREALKRIDAQGILFMYEDLSRKRDDVFKPEEKVALLGAVIPESNTIRYLIDGDSFDPNKKYNLLQRIINASERYGSSIIYLLLDTSEFELLKENSREFARIAQKVEFIIHILPGDQEVLETYSFTISDPWIIPTSMNIKSLARASIDYVKEELYEPVVIEYMNKSSDCAIRRLKQNTSEKRFKHSLRVAGTVKQICDVLEVEDAELRYDAYLAAIYHDICKEMEPFRQREIAEKKLGITGKHFKEYHAHIGAWYLKQNYLFDNQDILEAISQHTNPDPHPKDITVYLYLADKLELAKKDRYPEDVYQQAWSLIEQKKPVEALNFLLFYVEELRKSKKELALEDPES